MEKDSSQRMKGSTGFISEEMVMVGHNSVLKTVAEVSFVNKKVCSSPIVEQYSTGFRLTFHNAVKFKIGFCMWLEIM